jgi:hypothetical protein
MWLTGLEAGLAGCRVSERAAFPTDTPLRHLQTPASILTKISQARGLTPLRHSQAPGSAGEPLASILSYACVNAPRASRFIYPHPTPHWSRLSRLATYLALRASRFRQTPTATRLDAARDPRVCPARMPALPANASRDPPAATRDPRPATRLAASSALTDAASSAWHHPPCIILDHFYAPLVKWPWPALRRARRCLLRGRGSAATRPRSLRPGVNGVVRLSE